MKNILYILFSAVLFWSCEETILLDLNQTPSRIVIEGLVTNVPGNQGVKITRSVDFYDSGKTPRVTNAVVTVTDNLGNEVVFIHNPNNHIDSAGIYIPSLPFTGVVGRTYTLHVSVDGKLYEAQDLLPSVTGIDSLTYNINPDQQEDPKDEGKIYEIRMYAAEPQEQEDFYLLKFYRNDSLTFFNDTDIYFSDDKLFGDRVDGIASPIYFALNDMARMEMYSISRVGYVYYNDLSTLLNTDAGGMFGPIPASPRTNLSNGALGFFQVSALTSASIKIE